MRKSFRELRVWQMAMDLALLVYDRTAEFPKPEIYGLSSQMRRAAVSVASNIAEGSARGSKKDFRQFVLIAKGSVCELQTQLIIAGRPQYIPEQKLAEVEMLSGEIARMLSGLSAFLKIQTCSKRTSFA